MYIFSLGNFHIIFSLETGVSINYKSISVQHLRKFIAVYIYFYTIRACTVLNLSALLEENAYLLIS